MFPRSRIIPLHKTTRLAKRLAQLSPNTTFAAQHMRCGRRFLRSRSRRRPRPGDDGLLRGNHADDNLQNLRHLCGRGHLFRRSDLRRNPDDERSLSGRHSGPLRCAVRCRRARMGCWLDWLAHRADDAVGDGHDQARRTVTNQPSAESTEGQAGPRPHSMDGDRIRLRNGFPRWVPRGGDDRLSRACRECMDDRSQTPEDVRALGLESKPEVLL